jgi:hypothetical protein
MSRQEGQNDSKKYNKINKLYNYIWIFAMIRKTKRRLNVSSHIYFSIISHPLESREYLEDMAN